MPKKKIVIGQYDVSGFRLKPLNLLWGGPLLVKDHRRQKRQEQESNTAPPPVPEVLPAVEEAQPEAPPPDEPVIPVEPDDPPADAVKEESEKKNKEKMKHKKFRLRKYYDFESDSDSDSSSLGRRHSSYRQSQRRHHRPCGCHRDGCHCSHDAESEKRETKHRKQIIKAMRCPVCRQRVSLSSIEGDDSSRDGGSDAEIAYVCKRDKKKKRSKAKTETQKNEAGGDTEEQTIKDGDAKEDEPQVPSSATVPADDEVVTEAKAETEADEGNEGNEGDAGDADKSIGAADGDPVVVESNVMPTLQDATHPLLGTDVRADFLASSGVHPSQFPSSFHRNDHNLPPYLSEFADTHSHPYSYPSYPAYPYGYPPYPMYPYPHMTPPMAGYLQPQLPLPISPYAPTGAHSVPDSDGQGNRGEAAVDGANAQNDGGYDSALWHDMEPTTGDNMNKAEDEDKVADASNDQIDNWGIKWDDSGNNEAGVGAAANNDDWGCEPANTEGTADQSLTWTDSDLVLLGRLHAQHVTDRWRDLQAAFYNETGRMVDLEVLKSTAENAAGDQ